MNILKRILYIIGFIILVLLLFLNKELPKNFNTLLGFLCGIILAMIIIVEFLIKKKK